MLLEIREELKPLSKNFILDGELYKHGWSLQKINGAVSVNRVEPSKDTPFVEYHIFDCVLSSAPTLPFEARWEKLIEHLSDFQHDVRVKVVPTLKVFDLSEAESNYSFFKKLNYEGMMYRDPYSSYGFASQCKNKENRWTCLLKRKDWLDGEYPCIGINEGEGKYSGMVGSLILEVRPGLYVDTGSGLSDMQRVEYFENPPIGKPVRIKYEMFSDDGIPLKPIFECVFD
jgi:DNA ligase-1